MKFPSILSRANAQVTDPQKAAIRKRLATIEACDAFLVELRSRRAAVKDCHNASAHIGRQIEHVERAKYQLVLDAERKAVALVTERDMGEIRQSIKDNAEALQLAEEAAHAAQVQCAAMSDRIAPMLDQLANLQRQTQQRVADAEARFKEVMSSQAGDDAEAAASKAVFDARRSAGDAGGPLALRVEALTAQLVKLEASASDAKAARDLAELQMKKSQAMLRLVEYDQQAQKTIDAFVLASEAFRDAGGKPSPGLKGVESPVLQFSNVSHVVFGDKLDGYSNKTLPAYRLQDMVLNSRAVDLDLLLQPIPTDSPTEDESDVQLDDTDEDDGSDVLGRADIEEDEETRPGHKSVLRERTTSEVDEDEGELA